MVSAEEWTSQIDAAEALGVSVPRIGFLIAGQRLDAVHNAEGHAGVSAGSVAKERDRRANAGLLRRLWLLISDTGRALARGI